MEYSLNILYRSGRCCLRRWTYCIFNEYPIYGHRDIRIKGYPRIGISSYRESPGLNSLWSLGQGSPGLAQLSSGSKEVCSRFCSTLFVQQIFCSTKKVEQICSTKLGWLEGWPRAGLSPDGAFFLRKTPSDEVVFGEGYSHLGFSYSGRRFVQGRPSRIFVEQSLFRFLC